MIYFQLQVRKGNMEALLWNVITVLKYLNEIVRSWWSQTPVKKIPFFTSKLKMQFSKYRNLFIIHTSGEKIAIQIVEKRIKHCNVFLYFTSGIVLFNKYAQHCDNRTGSWRWKNLFNENTWHFDSSPFVRDYIFLFLQRIYFRKEVK